MSSSATDARHRAGRTRFRSDSRSRQTRCSRVEGVPPESYAALAGRYGHLAEKVLQTAAARGELAQPIVEGLPDLLAEVSYAAANEQARTVGDVLLRRTRLGLLAGREISSDANEAPRRVAGAIGAELGWDERRVESEIDRFREEAEAEGVGPQG